MESTQQKVERLQTELDALNAQSPRNEAAINQTANALDEAKKELEQEQAAQVRIQVATEQAAYFLDNLIIEGMTMRELCAGEAEYQVLKISVQNKIINMAEESARMLSESQSEDAARRSELLKKIEVLEAKAEEESREAYADHETIRQLRANLAQSNLERDDFESKLKNATNEIDRLNSQVDDLRKEIAVGARNAYKVTDVEQEQQIKQLAEQIKASRIHVYDVVAQDLNRSKFTAKRADTGEEISYSWTQEKNYIEIKDPNEVEQFRKQFADQKAVQDSALVEPVQNSVATEETFPEVPTAQAPDVPGEVSVVVPTPELGGQGQTVEERLSALEAHVFGYVKQAVA